MPPSLIAFQIHTEAFISMTVHDVAADKDHCYFHVNTVSCRAELTSRFMSLKVSTLRIKLTCTVMPAHIDNLATCYLLFICHHVWSCKVKYCCMSFCDHTLCISIPTPRLSTATLDQALHCSKTELYSTDTRLIGQFHLLSLLQPSLSNMHGSCHTHSQALESFNCLSQ